MLLHLIANGKRNHKSTKLQTAIAGKEQEQLARQAGFAKATHYEIGFGLMGTLVASK